MSARSTQIIGGPSREHAWVDPVLNALQVKVMNPGGSGTGDVNLVQYGGVAVGAGNALHVQPGTGAVFQVGDNGGSLTVDGTVAVTQSTSPWIVGQATHANLNATIRVQDRDSSDLLSVLGVDVGAVFPMTETGLIPLFLVTDQPDALGGTFTYGRMNDLGSIYVTVTSGTIAVVGTVAVTQSGAWTVGVSAVTPGTAATNLGKAEDAAHVTGDVGVMALAVRNDAQTALAGLTGDYIPITTNSAGALWVAQSTHANLNATVRIQDGSGSPLLEVVEDDETATDVISAGILPMFHVTATPVMTDETFHHGFMDRSNGGIFVHIRGTELVLPVSAAVTSVVPGTGATNLGKAEDAAHTTADVGVMALAVRRDTLTSTTSANNDYATLNVNNVGALWVKEYGVATVALSGSTRGRPIQITGTNSAGAVTLHTATTTTGELDRVFIWLTNTSTSAVTVTIEFGTTGTANELKIIVPANETVLAVDGAVIGGAATDVIEAYAGTANVVNAFGRVERLAA